LMNEHREEFMVIVDAEGRPRGYVDLDVVHDRSGAVGEHCAPLPATVRVEEDLRAAVSTMFMHDTRWLACVDSNGVFAGFITQRGITRLLGETYRAPSAVPH